MLPHLEQVSSFVSSYSRDGQGWYVLSAGSYLARGAIAALLLAPITILMGGTLTLLIRHLVRKDVQIGPWRIAVLYSVNTAGAAIGCLLTDLALVPAYGLRTTQFIAVAFNVVAGVGALWLAAPGRLPAFALRATARSRRSLGGGGKPALADPESPGPKPEVRSPKPEYVAVALALSGFAAMGMEILWFRHFSILLGEFRAVFSLLLGIILLGIAAGSFAGGFVHRRTNQPAQWLIVVQGLFIAATLLGLAAADAQAITRAGLAHAASLAATGREVSGFERAFEELWFNATPMLLEVGCSGAAHGLRVSARQRRHSTHRAFCRPPCRRALPGQHRRRRHRLAGVGLPAAAHAGHPGQRDGADARGRCSGRPALPGVAKARPGRARPVPVTSPVRRHRLPLFATVGSIAAAAVALGLWLRLPSDYVIGRALVLPVQRLLTLSEGITEVIAIADVPGRGRVLLTNGHPMSSTDRLSQRYMRALAHIPLLSLDNPEDVLVMCFGVGNTARAATLHPSVRRVDVVDLSRHVLSHAGYFADVNLDVLKDPRVTVHVNDGRHHLRMRSEGAYDLITLEPPPIVHAGVGALYSREFYALARTRLKPKGYISQWLPVSQVPAETTLAMIRAFVDVFPQSVLLSGAHTNLLLVGVNDSRIEVDPARLAAALSNAPAVQEDLQRLDLGSVREIVGTFVASARTLADATTGAAPATDDRPIQEYSARSLLQFGGAPPASIVDLGQVAAWCPTCFANGKPVPLVDGLDTYLALLNLVYQTSPANAQPAPVPTNGRPRVIAGSPYLGAVVPESADLHNVLGAALAARGSHEEAIAEYRQALRLDPDSATAHANLGRTLAAPEEALPHLRRLVELNPRDGEARYHLATVLLESRQYDDAIEEFHAALRLMPDSVEVRNNLGVALASRGQTGRSDRSFPAGADAPARIRRCPAQSDDGPRKTGARASGLRTQGPGRSQTIVTRPEA